MGAGTRRAGFLVAAAAALAGLQSVPSASAAPGAVITLTASSSEITLGGRSSVSAQITSGYLTASEWLSVYDDTGTRLQACSAGSCMAGGAIPVHESRTYTAYLATSAPPTSPPASPSAVSNSVTVTNVGFVGSIELAATSTRISWYERSSLEVRITSGSMTGSEWLSVYDETGRLLQACSAGSCSAGDVVPIRGSRTYTAYLAPDAPPTSPPAMPYAVSNPITVTNSGWSGTVRLTERAGAPGVLDAQASAWLDGYPYWLSVYDESGRIVQACSVTNCMGLTPSRSPGSVKLYRAYVSQAPPLQGPPTNDVAGISEVVVLTDLSDEEVLDSPEVAAMLAALAVTYGESQCLALGALAPTRFNGSSVPDVTLICNAYGPKAAIALLVVAVGVSAALAFLLEASLSEAPYEYPEYPPAPPAPDDPPSAPRPPGAPWGPPTNLDPGDLIRAIVIVMGRRLVGPSTAASPTDSDLEQVARQCMSLLQAAGRSVVNAANECASSRTLVVGGMPGRGREAAQHDLEVISAVPELAELEHVPESVALTSSARDWYTRSAYAGECIGQEVGQACDEYPLFSSAEGGVLGWHSYQSRIVSGGASMLKPIDARDNGREGTVYAAMVRNPACGFAAPGSDQHFLVIPLSDVLVDTFYVCGEGSFVE